MATVEERLAYLEGKVDEQSRGTGELREAIRHLDQKVDGLHQELSDRIDALDQKVDRFREALDQKLTRYFTWTVGLQVTVLLAVVGALLAR